MYGIDIFENINMLMQYSSINSRNLRNQALNFSANHIMMK